MFISKKKYESLNNIIFGLANTVSAQNMALNMELAELKKSTDEKLCAFAEDINEIKENVADLIENKDALITDTVAILSELHERIKPLEEEAEALMVDRISERQAIAGINNILSYAGVKHGNGDSTR